MNEHTYFARLNYRGCLALKEGRANLLGVTFGCQTHEEVGWKERKSTAFTWLPHPGEKQTLFTKPRKRTKILRSKKRGALKGEVPASHEFHGTPTKLVSHMVQTVGV